MYDAVAESALVEEHELGAGVGRQRRLDPTEDDGPDEQLAVVNRHGIGVGELLGNPSAELRARITGGGPVQLFTPWSRM